VGKSAQAQAKILAWRGAKRLPVAMHAVFGESGAAKSRVSVFDLSVDGFRIAAVKGVQSYSKVWLSLPGLAPLRAEVMWVRDGFAGCKFLQPLHPAVLEMIVGGAGPGGSAAGA
jgi:hypothetical protein